MWWWILGPADSRSGRPLIEAHQFGTPRLVSALLVAILLWAFVARASAEGGVTRAAELYRHAEYAAALDELGTVSGEDAKALAIAGRCSFQLGDFAEASKVFREATRADPGDASLYLWLGRSLGRQAERASFLLAPGYALKAKASLEKAVALDPKNVEALSDLFEYYLEAPGLLGGGAEKASETAERLRALDAAEYHWARARIAEKDGRFREAEGELREAARLSPSRVGRVIDLAKFLARRGRQEESDEAFEAAERLAPENRRLWFERARVYASSGRLKDARRLLVRYVGSTLTPDDPPRAEAEALLARLPSQ